MTAAAARFCGPAINTTARVLGLADRDVLRVRITMEPSSADALYRALPPDVRLLVVSAPGTASEGGPIGDGPLPRQAGGLAPGY